MWNIDGELYTSDAVRDMYYDMFGYTITDVGEMAEQLAFAEGFR